MGDEERGAASTNPSIRALSIRGDLGPVTRFALPAEAARPAPDTLRYLQGIAEQVRRLVRGALLAASAGGCVEEVQAVIDRLGGQIAHAYETELERQRRGDPDFALHMAGVECRRGCAFCCHVNVTVTVLEAARLARRLSAPDASDRRATIVTARHRLAGLDARERQALKAPCALLTGDACSVYEIRPLACRALLSESARLCEQQFGAVAETAEPPSLMAPRLIAAGFVSGEMAALRDLGLAAHLVELSASLGVLLEDATALPRWLGGADVFDLP